MTRDRDIEHPAINPPEDDAPDTEREPTEDEMQAHWDACERRKLMWIAGEIGEYEP